MTQRVSGTLALQRVQTHRRALLPRCLDENATDELLQFQCSPLRSRAREQLVPER